jgi:hypothetical protein
MVLSPLLWLNQTVIAVTTAVEQVQPVSIGIREEKEVMSEKLHLVYGFVHRHGFDQKAFRLDHPSRGLEFLFFDGGSLSRKRNAFAFIIEPAFVSLDPLG